MGDPNIRSARRKSAVTADNVKHRRTRSGCYTCRSRRVKCDETRPVCERCRKGGRECAYPDPPAGKSATGMKAMESAASKPLSESASSETDAGDSPENTLDAMEDEILHDPMDEQVPKSLARSSPSNRSNSEGKSPGDRMSTGKDSEPPPLMQDTSPSPLTDSTTPSGTSSRRVKNKKPRKVSTKPPVPSLLCSVNGSKWSHLPQELQFYLNYFQEHMTHHTYSFRHDGSNFLRTTFLEMALRHKPLLYAVVGFSAFRYALTRADSKIQDFLGFYTTSVSYLRASLGRSQKHNVATLLTILQLATVEENLGDWVNLKSHQKAACNILMELYTPETIMRSDMTRVIFDWYSRFDLFAGIMAGSETVLSRDWFSAYGRYYKQQGSQHPDQVKAKLDEVISDYRLLAMDMTMLFARRSNGSMEHDAFLKENASLTESMTAWRDQMSPSLTDQTYAIVDFDGAPKTDPEDIVDPYAPGVLLGGPLWRMNFAILGWYSTNLILKQQTALIRGTEPPADLEVQARKICQIFEAIELWPSSPEGSLLSAQASLAIASLFLPKDEKHTMWLRRKFAKIESMGYIYPHTFRSKMATLWSMPEVEHWWLPSDEGYPAVVRSIRSFVEERASQPHDSPSTDLKDIKGIFSAMKLDEPDTPSLLANQPGLDDPFVLSGSPDLWEMDHTIDDDPSDLYAPWKAV